MTATATRLRTRTLVLVLLVLGLVATSAGATSAPALADSGREASFVAKLNAERTERGLPALTVDGGLTTVARSWSGTMGGQGTLYHNPDLGAQVSGWEAVGENVGRGPSVDAIHAALMDSPGHRANILNERWTQVGIGVTIHGGQVWVTQVFREPRGATAPAPSPAAEPASASASDAAAAPTPTPEATPESTTATDPAPEPTPQPEPHPVVERPLPLDRVTITLARLDAQDLAELTAVRD